MAEKHLEPHGETANSISQDSWARMYESYPIGLVEAILWLAGSTLLQMGAGELANAGLVVLPDWSPEFGLQLGVFGFNTLALLAYFKFIKKAKLRSLGLRLDRLPGDLRFTLVAAAAGAAIYLVIAGIVWLGAPLFVDDRNATLMGLLHQAAYKEPPLLFLLSVVVIYPVLEEIWFRGLLYTPMRKEWGKWPAILITAALFAFAHDGWPPVNQFIGGLIFVWAYEMRRTLVAPMILHALGNGSLWVLGLALEHFGI